MDIVLIVAKCIVNENTPQLARTYLVVLIVAKCIVNFHNPNSAITTYPY